MRPKDAPTLLNWALVNQCYKKDYFQAERFCTSNIPHSLPRRRYISNFMRCCVVLMMSTDKKALFADPTDKRMLINYEEFLKHRESTSGLYYDGTPTMKVSTTLQESFTPVPSSKHPPPPTHTHTTDPYAHNLSLIPSYTVIATCI